MPLTLNKIPAFLILLTAVSCSSGPAKQASPPEAANNTPVYSAPPVVIEGTDIRLPIAEETRDNGITTYKIKAVYTGKPIGFDLVKRGGGVLVLRSTGEASDNFLGLLEDVYQQIHSPADKLVDSITVTGINLQEYAKELNGNNGSYQALAEYKVFFRGKKEEDYAELYLNINSPDRTIEWKEKDPEYRPVFGRILTKK